MRWSRFALGIGLSLFFLYLTLFIPRIADLFAGRADWLDALFGHSRIDFQGFVDVLAAAYWWPVVLAGVLFFVALFVRAWRWRIMLSPIVHMRYVDVFGAMCIGYMANNVLPLRMGEVYRAQVVYQISGLSRSAALGNVVLERVIDLLFMMPYLGLAILLFPVPGVMRIASIILIAAVVVIMCFLVWMVVDRPRALMLARRVLSVLPHKAAVAIMSLLEKFTSGFDVLRKPDRFLGIAAASLLLWAMYAGMLYCILLALGFLHAGYDLIDNNLLGAVLVMLMITTVGFTLPSAPGAVGTYHGMAVLGLSLFSVPGDRAAGFAILLHALNYIPLTLLGLIFFWRLGLSFRGATKFTAETVPERERVLQVDVTEK
jgi:glycosyltransferase 2 family protein